MIQVHVPATSANCCVGFDTMGLALDWFGTFTFMPSDTLEITGCPKEFCDENNLVLTSFKAVCEYMKKEMPTFHLHINTDIPFSRGLGSSSTCVVAGVLAADKWFDAGLNKMELLSIATKIEGHPDNVAPALFGQACTSFMEEDNARLMMIPCANFKGLVLIPDYPISTVEARKVLPETITYKDAVKQVSYALSFSQSLQTGNEMILNKACHDFLHEPYRSKLIKEYDDIKEYCKSIELALWISGSGSTMLAMSLDDEKIDKLNTWISKYKNIQTRKVQISRKGAFVTYE